MIFTSGQPNFLSLHCISNLKVVRGHNILDTCYQYHVKNDRNVRILNVKIYDKMIDMLSREDCHTIGTRTSNIIGSKHHLDSFDIKLRDARFSGMTRLEVSICQGAFD